MRRHEYGAPPADTFRKRPESEAPENCTDIVDHRDGADGCRREFLRLQKGRIQVLRAVAEEIEARHQQYGVETDPPMRLEEYTGQYPGDVVDDGHDIRNDMGGKREIIDREHGYDGEEFDPDRRIARGEEDAGDDGKGDTDRRDGRLIG